MNRIQRDTYINHVIDEVMVEIRSSFDSLSYEKKDIFKFNALFLVYLILKIDFSFC
jgi:hypothetical protein